MSDQYRSSKIDGLTITEILSDANDTYTKISETFIPTKQCESLLADLESNIHQLQSLTVRLAIIYNKCKTSTARIRTLAPDRKHVTSEKDWKKIISSKKKQFPVAPGLNIWSNTVKNVAELPDTSIFHIQDTNQFGFCINGIVLKGNIGNILTSGIPRRRIKECYCNDPGCQKYHPDKHEIRNFTADSFTFTVDKMSKHNINMRFIGSRNTLLGDIHKHGHRNLQLFRDQVMHDVLVLLAIEQHISQ